MRGRKPTVFSKELSGLIPRTLTKEEAKSGEETVTIRTQQDEEMILSQEDIDTKWEKHWRG